MKVSFRWESLLNDIFPQHCHHCRLQPPSNRFLCDSCLDQLDQCVIPPSELPGWTPKGRPVWGKWYYRQDSPIRTLHRLLKYEGIDEVGRFLGDHFLQLAGDIHWCTAIPSHRTKILERGFLHTLPIAEAFSAANQLHMVCDCIVRPSLTISQSGLTRELRISNTQSAFKATSSVENKHLLLVDDVMTTGATLDAAAEVLEQSGARVTLAVAAFRRESFFQHPLLGLPNEMIQH